MGSRRRALRCRWNSPRLAGPACLPDEIGASRPVTGCMIADRTAPSECGLDDGGDGSRPAMWPRRSLKRLHTPRAKVTPFRNRRRPSCPRAPRAAAGCCQENTWFSGWGIKPRILPAALVMPAMSATEPLGLTG